MKKKLAPKTIPPDSTDILPPNLIGKVPASLKRFEGKQLGDAVTQILTEQISVMTVKDSDAEKILIGVYSGIPYTKFDVPEWVKLASQKMFEAIGFDFLINLQHNSEHLPFVESVGKGIGITQEILKNPDPPSTPLGKYLQTTIVPLISEIKQLAGKAEAEEAGAFFDGQRAAKKNIEKLKQPTVRGKIYIVLVTRWFEIERLKSTGELKSTNDLYKWLLPLKDRSGNIILPIETDSRQIRSVCECVGLAFQNSWRKPKPKNLGNCI